MELITNEVWLLLDDGRLISMNKVAAPGIIAEGRAELIPPERVMRDGGLFVLLDADDKRVKASAPVETAAVAPPEKAVATSPRTRKPA